MRLLIALLLLTGCSAQPMDKETQRKLEDELQQKMEEQQNFPITHEELERAQRQNRNTPITTP